MIIGEKNVVELLILYLLPYFFLVTRSKGEGWMQPLNLSRHTSSKSGQHPQMVVPKRQERHTDTAQFPRSMPYKSGDFRHAKRSYSNWLLGREDIPNDACLIVVIFPSSRDGFEFHRQSN